MSASTAIASVVDVESFINEYFGAWQGTNEDRIMSYYAENVVLQIPGAFMEGKRPSVSSLFGHSSPASREIATSPKT